MKTNKTWVIFTIILVVSCIALASHLSYRKAAKHFRDKKMAGLGGSWGKPFEPLAPMPAPGGTINAFTEPFVSVSPEVSVETTIAKYEMYGIFGTGFCGVLSGVLPLFIKRWLKMPKREQ